MLNNIQYINNTSNNAKPQILLKLEYVEQN